MHSKISPAVRLLCAAALLGVFAGCASTEKYHHKLRTWVGHEKEPLVQAWGAPDATEKMSNGNSMMVYARLKHVPLAFNEAPPANPVRNMYVKCATYFEIDARDRIVGTTFVGDECSKACD